MNLFALLSLLFGIGGIIGFLYLLKVILQEYRDSREHNREMEEKEKEAQEKLFENEDL